MSVVSLIERKRDGKRLSIEEIDFPVRGFNHGETPDDQMAAFLMAVCLRGMDSGETIDLTLSMIETGVRADLLALPGIPVDKHSAGGAEDLRSPGRHRDRSEHSADHGRHSEQEGGRGDPASGYGREVRPGGLAF